MAASADETIKALIRRIKYTGENEFGIAAASGAPDSGLGQFDCKGPIARIAIDTLYELSGNWENHPRYGRQFRVNTYRMVYPTDLEGISRYLRNNIRWLGPVRSNLLLEAFGDKTLDMLRDYPVNIAAQIPGITIDKAKEISADMQARRNTEALLVELEGLFAGTLVTRTTLSDVAAMWGQEGPAKVRENAYSLIDHFRGVGFLVADSVARKLGIAPDSPFRIAAGIVHVMQQYTMMEGHVCFPKLFVISMTSQLLKIDQDKPLKVLNQLLQDQPARIVMEDSYIYFPETLADEHYIAERIRELMSVRFDPVEPDLAELHPDQVKALKEIALGGAGVFILTGAPGTGKTFEISRIVSTFPGANVLQVAPTGKAAKRVQESSGREAKTIHRALEPMPRDLTGSDFIFQRNEDNPFEHNIIICDECSMVDNWLFANLLRAVSPGTRLILVGDVGQLPSVGPGNILKDLIAAGIPTVELDHIKRQDAGLIVRNCFAIRKGFDIDTPTPDPDADFMFIPRTTEESIQSAIITLLRRLPTATYNEGKGYDVLNDVQVIVPRRQQVALSCEKLNPILQEELVGRPPSSTSHYDENGKLIETRTKFQEGDKVIQTRNDYKKEIMNGDIGRVLTIAGGVIFVRFDNPIREVDLPLVDNSLELAYAITCHKFQGSEAKVVIVPIHKSGGSLVCQRNWIYTALSRASKLCIVVGEREEITKIIQRRSQQSRYTRLQQLLKKVQPS